MIVPRTLRELDLPILLKNPILSLVPRPHGGLSRHHQTSQGCPHIAVNPVLLIRTKLVQVEVGISLGSVGNRLESR
ncbi:hypothetical protein Dimus_038339 [Dionaea muscipula]